MQNIIKTFINGAISAYMVEVTKHDISGSLTHQNLVISQLEIFPDALLQHGIPLLIKKGTIKNVIIHIPTKFKTDPIKISIDSVAILGSLCANDPTPDSINNMKARMLKSYKYFRKCYKIILGILSKDNLMSIFRTIMSNVIMEINHIHIQIEYSSNKSSGQIISQFSFSTSNSKSEQNNSNSNPEEDFEEDEKNDTKSKSLSDDYSYEESSDSEDFITAGVTRLNSFEITSQTSEEKVTSIGIVIPKLVLHNPENLEVVSNKNIVKEAVFTDLGIYMDMDTKPISKEKCDEELNNLYNSKKHNWIMKPFSFTGSIKFKKNDPQIFFEPIIKTVLVNIKEQYIPVIIDILKTFESFQKKFSVAQIPKPSFEKPNDLWIYCHKCAVSKISNPTFDFSKNLNLLLKRVVFLKNYKKKNQKSQKIIKEMENELDYTTIVAFRAAYRLTHHKKRKGKGKSKISAKTTKKIIKEIRIDPIHIVTKIVINFALDFSGGLLSIKLKRNTGHKLATFHIKNIHLMIEKDLKSTLVHASASYVCVKYAKEKEMVVFKSIDNDQVQMKFEMIIPFLSYSNWLISLQVSKNNYTINLDALLQILTDLVFVNLDTSEISRQNIIAFIKNKHIELNIQVLSSIIKVFGSRSNRAIQYAFDTLSFSTDPKTLEKSLKLNNAWISLITDTEAKVSSDFSLTGSLVGKNISLNIPLFTCAIPFKYIVVIQDFIGLFMKHQVLFRVDVFKKIDLNFKLDMKGMNINIKLPDSNQSKNLQIRDIILKFKNSILKFKLESIIMTDLFSLNHLSAVYSQNLLDFKLRDVSARVMDLIALVPKDALQIIKNQNQIMTSKSDFDSTTVSETNSESDSDSKNPLIKHDNNIELPKIKIGFLIDKFKIELPISRKTLLHIYLKDINASMNNNKLNTKAILDEIKFEDLIIAKQIYYQSEVVFDQIIEITLKTDNTNLNISKKFIYLLLQIKFPSQEIALPHDIGMKLSFQIDQMSLSNDLIMKKFSSCLFFMNSKIDASIALDSIDSSIVKFKSKDVVKMSVDIKQHIIDLAINLDKIIVFVIPLIDVLSLLSKTNIPASQNNLNVKINPIMISLCFGEDNLNVIFESPIKLIVNTLRRLIPYVSLKVSDFSINLNDTQIVQINSLNFILDKNIVIDIPSMEISLSMVITYHLIKMISLFTKSSFANSPKKILIYEIPIDTIITNAPLIRIVIYQTKSRRCVILSFEDTEFHLKNSNQRAELFAQTTAHFIQSDGFISMDLTEPFTIISKGELSHAKKNCMIQLPNLIKFELTTNGLNQIIKNLTATEDDIEQPYSIINETGSEISILINDKEHILKPQEFLPNITNFVDSDIKVKIGAIINPIQFFSSYSKISFPLFFGKHYILVWVDSIKLQLRLLSPISLKNKSNANLEIMFDNQSMLLKKNETICLDFTIEKLDTITIRSDYEQQKVNLNEISYIKIANKFINISKKRQIETLHTVISFSTPYYFRNELISNMTISIKELNGNEIEKINLQPSEIVPIPFFSPESETISFDILDSQEIKGVHVDLNLKEIKNQKHFITTKLNNGKQFILQFSFITERLDVISISPLIIYYNSLSIPIVFGLSLDEEIENEKLNLSESLTDIFPNQGLQNMWNFDKPIMISPLIEDTKKIDIYITTKYSKEWAQTPFTLTNFDIINNLAIPIDDEKVSLAHCHVFYDTHLSPNTFVFFIVPQYAFHNQTNETFSLNLFDEGVIEAPPYSTIPVTIIRKSLNFSFAIVPKLKGGNEIQNKKKNLNYSNTINLETVNSQYIKIHPYEEPILLQLSIEKEINFITFLLNRTLPYLFINNTEYKVFFFQKNTFDTSHTVLPNQSLPFFIFDENMPTIIYCEISNVVSFEIDINQLSFPEKIETPGHNNKVNLYYYVDLSTNDGSTITLCNVVDDEINITKNAELNSSEYFTSYLGLASRFDESSISFNVSDISHLKDDIFYLTLNINHISFLIITDQYQELCNLTLKNINIDSNVNKFITKTKMSIGTVKFDDQDQYAIYPSIFQILPSANKPAIQFIVHSFGSHKYGKFELEIRPVSVRIDLSFISDFIGSIFYLDDYNDINENKHDRKKFEFKMNDIPLTEIIHNIMPEQNKYHINHILIHPFVIYLSFHARTTRYSHPLQQKYQISRIVHFIPSFDNVAITFNNSHSFRNLTGASYEISYKISQEIKEKILNQLSIKNHIVGTKEKIQNVIQLFIQPEARMIFINGLMKRVALIFSFAESTFCYLSSMLDLYTGLPPKNRTDETSLEAIYWGLSSFISSLKEGAKQLIKEPIKRRTFGGFFVGAGIGITKFAANVASGLCSFTASIFSSAKRIFTGKKIVFVDERECEPSLGMHVTKDEHLLWYTRSQSSGLIEVYTSSVYIMKENKLIQSIIRAEINDSSVTIYDIDQNKYTTIFDNESQAIFFYHIIESQLLRKKILEIHEDL